MDDRRKMCGQRKSPLVTWLKVYQDGINVEYIVGNMLVKIQDIVVMRRGRLYKSWVDYMNKYINSKGIS